MKRIRLEKVYITKSVEADPRALRRAERLAAGMQAGEVVRGVTDEQLNELVVQRGWNNVPLWGQIKEEQKKDPDMVLDTFKFHHTPEERKARYEKYPHLKHRNLSGYAGFDFRSDGSAEFRRKTHVICQSAWEFHTISGCPFRCGYCWFGGVNNVKVNIEYFIEHADRRIKELNPPQTIYKWDNQTDINCFEPEYDATRLMVDYFAQQKRNFLLLYTGKSDNVDFMLNYDHKGQTIIQWSLAARTQSMEIEKETAPWDARVEAAAKCEKAGYHVRFRFSPIFPVRNWQQEYKELIELIFAKTHPDVMSLCMFGWMDYERAHSCIDMSLIDERFVKAMEGTASFLKGKRYGPLPHEAREEIYDFLITEIKRVSPDTPIALCLDTREMWTRFQDRLGMGPDNYVCVCGPLCTPGNPMLRPHAAM